jgi:hypothetical protein
MTRLVYPPDVAVPLRGGRTVKPHGRCCVVGGPGQDYPISYFGWERGVWNMLLGALKFTYLAPARQLSLMRGPPPPCRRPAKLNGSHVLRRGEAARVWFVLFPDRCLYSVVRRGARVCDGGTGMLPTVDAGYLLSDIYLSLLHLFLLR